MNITEIKARYDYDNPNGDFFYESINCAEAVQRMKDFSWLINEVERLKGDLSYPIQDGPTIPWFIMKPHEAQCQKNHGQSLEKLAGRGGLGAAEAYCIIKGLSLRAIDEVGHNQLRTWWFEYADSINGLKTRAEEAEATNAKLMTFIHEVEVSADRAYLRTEAWKLIELLEEI